MFDIRASAKEHDCWTPVCLYFFSSAENLEGSKASPNALHVSSYSMAIVIRKSGTVLPDLQMSKLRLGKWGQKHVLGHISMNWQSWDTNPSFQVWRKRQDSRRRDKAIISRFFLFLFFSFPSFLFSF